ncbi:MAG: methyl-accepting chemotaxis protein [Clostridia bacterium]|nr:methyl-accepting chemotaxis protein [Clostridia bacterium]
MKRSIKTKLMVTFILVIAVPLIVLGVLTYRRTESVIYDSFEASNEELVNEVEYGVENYMGGYKMAVEIFAGNETTRTVYESISAKKTMMMGFETYLKENPEVLFLYMGTERKDMFDPSWPDVPDTYDPTDRPWYTAAKDAGGTAWTDPYVDADTGLTIISVSTPVYNTAKRMIGVVAMDISLQSLADEMNDIQIGQSGYPVILDSSNKFITHKDSTLLGKPIEVQEIIDAISAAPEDIVDYTVDGSKKFAVYKKIEQFGWTVIIMMDAAEVNVLTQPIMMTTAILVVICLILGILVASYQSKSFVKPVIALEHVMESVKEGDLTVRSEVNTDDEIGQMARNFNTMIDHFVTMLSKSKAVAHHVSVSAGDLAASSEEVSASSDEVARAVDEIAHGSTDQARETEKGAELIGGLAEKIQVLTKDSDIMSSAAGSVIEANARGTDAMVALKTKTSENNAATSRIAKAVQGLEVKSSEIGGILETITAIADQTNLLALNASIEAARAGEHGKGFAVVAEEIRKLAEGSGDAAENIRKIVSEIQMESKNTVSIMSEVEIRTEEQGIAVKSVDDVFEEIHTATQKITDIIGEVVKFIDGVNTDKDRIVESIESISAVSEESAAAAEEVTASMQQQTSAIEEVARAAEQLNEMAEELQKEISAFKID